MPGTMDIAGGLEADHNSRHCILIFWGVHNSTRLMSSSQQLWSSIILQVTTQSPSVYVAGTRSPSWVEQSWVLVPVMTVPSLLANTAEASQRAWIGQRGRLNIITVITTVWLCQEPKWGSTNIRQPCYLWGLSAACAVLLFYLLYYIILDNSSFIHSCWNCSLAEVCLELEILSASTSQVAGTTSLWHQAWLRIIIFNHHELMK